MQISSLESGDQTKRHKAIHNDESTEKSLSCYQGRDYSKHLPFELIKLVLSFVTYGESTRLNRTCKRIRKANINFNPFLHYLSQPVKPVPTIFELPDHLSSDKVVADLENNRFFISSSSSNLSKYAYIYGSIYQQFRNKICTVTQLNDGNNQVGVKIVDNRFELKERIEPFQNGLVLESKKLVFAEFPNCLKGWHINTTEPIEWLNKVYIKAHIMQSTFSDDTVLINGHVLCTKKGLNCSFRKAPDNFNYKVNNFHHDSQRQRAFIGTDTDYTVVNSENGDIIHQVTFANENYEGPIPNWSTSQYIIKEGWVVLRAEHSVDISHVRIVEIDSGNTILMHYFKEEVLDFIFDSVTKRFFIVNLRGQVDDESDSDLDSNDTSIDCWQLENSKETGMSLKYLYSKFSNDIYEVHIESRILITACTDNDIRFFSIDDNLKEISNFNFRMPYGKKSRLVSLLDSKGFSVYQNSTLVNNTTHAIIKWQFKKLNAPQVKVTLEVLE